MSDDLARVLDAAPASVDGAEFLRRPVVLYGGGRLGQLAARLLTNAGVPIAAVVDQNARSLESKFAVPVLTVDEAAARIGRDCTVFDCVYKVAPGIAESALGPHGFKNVRVAYDLLSSIDALHFTNGWQSGELTDEDREGIREVYGRLSDDLSRASYLYALSFRIGRETFTPPGFSLIAEEDKYWNPLTRRAWLGGTAFVDAGAFDLFFTLQALDPAMNPARPSAIVASEPDPESFARVERLVQELSCDERALIRLSDVAIAEHGGEAPFICGNDLASRLVAPGETPAAPVSLRQVQTISLDELTRDLSRVGYLKLHVEGEELRCLRGATQCLRGHRPILAVNSTHTRDGLWEIARFVMAHTERYRYFFRAYAFYGDGLTFYAIPEWP